MGKNEIIVEKINQIIKLTNSAYVYTDECACIVKLLKELREKIKSVQDNKLDDQNNTEILNNLNKLYEIINGFKQDEWQKVCLTLPIIKPFTLLTETTNSLTDSLAKIDIKLTNEYNVLLENVTNELKTIYGIFADPSQQEKPEVKKKLHEIEKYLKKVGQPLFESTKHKRRRSNNKSKDKVQQQQQQEVKKDKDDNSPEEDENEFNDFSNIQKYKIKRSDYDQEQKVIFHCQNYTLYKGRMKASKDEANIIILDTDNYPIEKVRTIVNVLISAQHPNLETFVGAVLSSPPYTIVTRKSGPKLSDILRQSKRKTKSDTSDKDDKDSIWKNGNRTKIAFDIASAMAYLHSNNIIHRDLCSSNITIDENMNPRITNFVNSRFLPEDLNLLSSNPYVSSSFKAPELSGDDNYDETVDVFAFGGILYELLTGKKPFEKLSSSEIEEEIRQKHRPKIPEEASPDLRDLIESCWDQEFVLRPSFTDIIDLMLTNQICFPNDDEYSNQFYSTKLIKNNSLEKCLDMFKNIKMAMQYSFQYVREILRTRSFLHAYQFVLQNSDYATQDESENPDVLNTYQYMYESLVNLFMAVMDASDDHWESFSPNNSAVFIPETIYQSMEEIYISMTELGFKVSKYEYVNGDLIIDLRRVYSAFKANEVTIQQTPDRLKEIEDFLHERGLELEVTQEEINEQLKVTFKPFTDFYVNRNDFEINEEIGSGYSSFVYKAERKSTGEVVAIKEFKNAYIQTDGIMPYLRREISALVHLRHKYIIKFIGFNNDALERPWLITEIVEGGDLYNANIDCLIDPFQKTKIAFEIAEGMEYLHKKRIIHRDLKTLNILLTDDRTPKITDFGYSRVNLSMTMTKQAGTRNYMSPEIILGGDYSFATDVFSFALLLWELYSLEVPYSWTSNIEDEIVNNAPLKYKKPISKELANLIEDTKLMDPNARPTFTQIIQRMIQQKICFNDADSEKVEEFYKMKEMERNLEK